MLNTPVLFIVFNRPDTTRRVFEAIRAAKPRQLFVASDGPRPDRQGEAARCEEVRRIATAVDWDCELKTLFRTENLGCGLGPKTAIDWFFANVEQGIILEDDCLPSPDFFKFCDFLLNHYCDDYRVMHIAGTNLRETWNADESDYFYSNYAGIWGWATWRRSWDLYDYTIKLWGRPDVRKLISTKFFTKEQTDYYSKMYQKTFRTPQLVTWWDYQWHFARLINSGLGIVPSRNLVSNIGFGPEATHTFDSGSPSFNIRTYPIEFPLRLNDCMVADNFYDQSLIDASQQDIGLVRLLRRVLGVLKVK